MIRALGGIVFYAALLAGLVLAVWLHTAHTVTPALTPHPAPSGEVSI